MSDGDTSTASLQLISARRDNSSSSTTEPSSRFYVKKRIIVGNTSKAIPPGKHTYIIFFNINKNCNYNFIYLFKLLIIFEV